jgi:hypothetical protein
MPVTLDFLGPLVYPVVDPADSGLIYITDLLGTKAGPAGEKVKSAIKTQANLEPKVSVVTLTEFTDLTKTAGLVPGLTVAASDQIYLGKNEVNAVVATGSIPTTHELGRVSDIAAQAGNAEQIAKGIDGRVGAVEKGFTTFQEDLEEDFGEFKEGLENDFLEFKNSLPLKDIQTGATLGEKIHQVELEVGKQGATITQLDTRTKTLETRGFPTGGPGGGRGTPVINTSLYEALDAMSEAIKAGSTQRAGPAVRRKLASVDSQFEVLRREAVGEEPLTSAHPTALVEVMDGIVEAVTAMGLSPESAEFKNLTKNVAAFKGAMGIA